MQITIYNQTHSGPSNQEVVDAAYALNYQANRHILPAWGLRTVHIVAATPGTTPKPASDNWPLYLLDTSDQPGALGYHDDSGVPLMKVFALTCKQDNVSWTSCASHEIAEALVDPTIDRLADDGNGKAWAIEVGDPVQRDSYTCHGASGNPVEVSNFAFPALFSQNATGQLDHLGKASAKFGGSAGGYMQWTTDMNNWHQVGEDLMAGYVGRPQARS